MSQMSLAQQIGAVAVLVFVGTVIRFGFQLLKARTAPRRPPS